MDYNTILKNLRIDKNQTVDEIKELDKNKVDELKEAKRLIEEKYSDLMQKTFSDLDRKNIELYNYCKLIEKNATLNYNIFYVITELISIFEGEKYVLERVNYHKDKSSPASVRETYMIMSKSTFENIKNPKYVKEQYFHHLLKNGLAIKIFDDWSSFSLPEKFSFYKTDDIGRLNPQISFKGFPYIKEFVDYIINYRIENKVDELSKKDMQKLKDNFILLNVNNIYNNYQFKTEQKIKKDADNLSCEYDHKKKILKRIVKKIEENK